MLVSFLFASLVFAPSAHAFDYSDLRTLVLSRDLRSVEDTLPLLPASMRSNVVLMSKSRSLQAGTLDQPRAIIFNDDGSLVVSFTGAPRGSGRFEIIAFSDDRFEFKSIQFGAGRAAVLEHPQNCFGCHGRIDGDLRPVWDPGLVWRGAFGEENDMLTAVEEEAIAKLSGVYSSLHAAHEENSTLVENRPNLRLGLLFMRQQAKRVTRLAGGATQLRQKLCSSSPLGVDADEVSLTLERHRTDVFDGSFAFRDLLFGELARDAGLPMKSVVESPLGLKHSAGTDAIDRVGRALDSHSGVALCQM